MSTRNRPSTHDLVHEGFHVRIFRSSQDTGRRLAAFRDGFSMGDSHVISDLLLEVLMHREFFQPPCQCVCCRGSAGEEEETELIMHSGDHVSCHRLAVLLSRGSDLALHYQVHSARYLARLERSICRIFALCCSKSVTDQPVAYSLGSTVSGHNPEDSGMYTVPKLDRHLRTVCEQSYGFESGWCRFGRIIDQLCGAIGR
jgi:hypothetical protein